MIEDVEMTIEGAVLRFVPFTRLIFPNPDTLAMSISFCLSPVIHALEVFAWEKRAWRVPP